jgi:uncharacterized protein involved in outer membrane biogenesis
MALSRKTKTWLVILSIPIVLLVGGAIALKLYFTNERLKTLVVPRIEEATGRSISIGNIGLSVFPSIAIHIDSLSVANRTGHGFSEQPLLSLEQLVLDLRIIPLLSGRLEIPTVVLQRPQLLLEISSDGIRNYRAENPALATPDTGTAARAPKGTALLLSNLQIVDGAIDMIDHQENSATRLYGFNYQMKIDLPAAANQAGIEGAITINDISYGTPTSTMITGLHLTIDHSLLYELDKDLLTIQRGEGTLERIPLRISGTIAHLMGDPEPNLLIDAEKVSIPELLSLAPKEYLQHVEGLQGTGSAQIKITVSGIVTDTTKADLMGVISTTDASVHFARLPKPISNISLVADFTRTRVKQQFRLTRFSARLGENPVAATMVVNNFNDPALTLNAKGSLPLAEVKDYYPLEEGTQLSGFLKANVNIDGKVSTPAGMKASGTMECNDVTIKTPGGSSPIRGLNGTITFNNQIVESKKLSMQVGMSDLTLAFWLKNYLSLIGGATGVPAPTANLTLTSNRLVTSDLTGEPSAGGQPTRQTGKESQQKPGFPLPNVDMDISASIGTLTMEKFELQNVRSTLKIHKGVMTIQSLSCNTFGGSVITRGAINMQKPDRPTFDLVLDVNGVSANALLSNFTSFGKLLNGKLTMNTTMRGALNDTLGLVTQALNGQGRAQLESGNLTGFKVNSTIASLLSLPDLQQINFKDWSNTFSISDGRINIKDLKITALGADYVVNGSQGLDGSLDYTMAILLSQEASNKVTVPGFAGEALKLFKDESGRVKLDFTVGGISSNPTVALDTKPAQMRAEEAAKQKLTDEAKKVEEQLKQKGQNLLKDLFKKKK